MEEESKPYLP